jgi:hypothetical protein
MFVIDAPAIRETETGIRLEAPITIKGETRVAYFEVDAPHGAYLTLDRADPFLVAFFFYALRLGEDIEVKAPVSEPLHYHISSVLMDFLVSIYPEHAYRPVRLLAPTITTPVANQGAVGTGVSCGIDSLTTIFRHHVHPLPSMALTHLCYFDTGSHGRPGEEKMEELFVARRKLALNFGSAIGLPVVEVRSNLSELMPLAFGLTHTYLNAAAVLALQPLFSTYYYASGASILDFLASNSDPAYFDTYLLPLLSTRSLRLYAAEENLGRIAKTRVVIANPLSRRFLNVCNVEARNCGTCNKCIRTLLALDALGVVEQYGEVFDLDSYKSLRDNHLVYHYKHFLKKNPSHLNLHTILNRHLKLSHHVRGISQYLRGELGRLIRNITGRLRS